MRQNTQLAESGILTESDYSGSAAGGPVKSSTAVISGEPGGGAALPRLVYNEHSTDENHSLHLFALRLLMGVSLFCAVVCFAALVTP